MITFKFIIIASKLVILVLHILNNYALSSVLVVS